MQISFFNFLPRIFTSTTMHKSLLIFWVTFFGVTASAQVTTSFPTERDKFPKALDDFMRANRMENCVKAADDFGAILKSATLSEAQLQNVITTANVMAGRLMGPNLYFTNYLTAVVSFAKSKTSNEQFANWNKVCQQLAVSQKKGENRDYLKFMEFSVALSGKNALQCSDLFFKLFGVNNCFHNFCCCL